MSRFEELKRALREAVRAHFALLMERYDSSDVYGYSLYTDDGVSSIGPVANSTDRIPVPPHDPSHNYYRYGPHEWALFDDYSAFDSVNPIVKRIHEDPDLTFEFRRDGMLQVMFEVLVALEAEGLFGQRTASRYVVLWLSDSGNPIMSASAEALNSPAVFAQYRTEYGDGG
jgi:hypothetical protein